MMLDISAAKALFAIVLTSSQGGDELNRQLPLSVVDRGENLLVTGTPYTDRKLHTRYRMCHMFFQKRSAEVIGVNCHGRVMLTATEERRWSKTMTKEEFDRAFAPDTQFEPDGIRDIWFALYGGIIPDAKAAVAYAVVLMRAKPAWAALTAADLIATEKDKVWHISGRHLGTRDLITLSKSTGKVLSGDL